MRGSGAAVLWAGSIAGVLDITEVCVFHALRGVQPARILQSIASGLLGREAYKGGAATAALGLGLHFVIAFTAAAVYYAASRRIAALNRRPVIWGALYGLAVYGFMNFVVLPLSAFPGGGARSVAPIVNSLFAHVFCVGLPISLAVRHYSKY